MRYPIYKSILKSGVIENRLRNLSRHYAGIDISRDENGRERSGKLFNHSRNCIFWSGTEAGTKKSDGKTKSVLRDIGNGINRSGACRLRSGIDNSKRKNTYNHFKHLTR